MQKLKDIEEFLENNTLATVDLLGYEPSKAISTIEGLYEQANTVEGSCILTAMIIDGNDARIERFLVSK